jgi:phage baseplate assembly protein W
MQTLALVNGDLVLNSGTYLTFSGPDKIRQDLDLALNEAYGADQYHPLWGSILDRFIGQPLTSSLQSAVLNEVTRVLANYIAVQTDDISSDTVADTLSRYDTGDVVQSVESIDATVSMDKITVSVVLRTLSNQTITINRQVIA